MKIDLPELRKSLEDLAPSRRDIVDRIKGASTKTLIVALGLIGIHPGTQQLSASGSPKPVPTPTIVNRRDKSEASTLVLNLADTDQDTSDMLAHRSHSSHRSHYSSVSGGTTSTKPSTPTKTKEDASIVNAQKLVGTISEVPAGKDDEYFELKDEEGNFHTIYYKGTTTLLISGATEQKFTVETLKSFGGSLPLKVGKVITVFWKQVETKKTAIQINLLSF